ncbi:Two pore domain potassium channel domain [Lasallia pustulata]|uniref:Two pore domain potassium channel domain n=1 Tax=Lasallia pustulata TaxID=136370 RepID=A0A1W5CXZ9_9LECA|nr:Two pore domain potassium channel domain [Lasallia pustulata]
MPEQNTGTAAEPGVRERPEEYVTKDEEEAEEDYLAPSRWWFSSTLFPLIAGTFGPLATAFNICALVMDWRVIVDSSSAEAEGADVRDPKWLLAVNGMALVIAVLANLATLAHMFNRLSFTISQSATIGGWYVSSFLLTGLIAAAPSRLPLPAGENRTFSQAYYYAILSAALYSILASLLVVTSFGVYIGRYSRNYKLSFSQRTLMVQAMAFLGYILAAAAVFGRVEGWNFLDAVYWTDVTILTIGFGDYSPKTHLGRGLLFPMAIGGILFLGLIIASIRTLVLERGTKKVTVRMVEKAREQALKHLDIKQGTVRFNLFRKSRVPSNISSELDRREQEFNIMREVQKKAANDNRMIAFSTSAVVWIFLWFVGAVVFWQAEQDYANWTYFESLYFTYVSLLTIGYGDFYPQDNSAKPAFVLWSMIALPTLTVLIGAIGDLISEGVDTLTLWIGKHLPNRKGTLADLKGNAAKAAGSAYQQAKPPGFMSNAKAEDGDFDTEAEADAVAGIGQNMEESSARGDTTQQDANAAGKHYRHYLLMKEMKNVVQHLNASPPRQYSYAEWAWFLKLLGEDESASDHHRSIGRIQIGEETGKTKENAPAGAEEGDGEVQVWSWMGPESPLMSSIEEPKWVLGRLMSTLEEELKQKGDEHDGRKSKESPDEKQGQGEESIQEPQARRNRRSLSTGLRPTGLKQHTT